MRKDVILGLSIGGVLLAVVIVYITVTPNHKPKQSVRLDTGSGLVDGNQSEAGGAAATEAAVAAASTEAPAATASPSASSNLAGRKPTPASPATPAAAEPVAPAAKPAAAAAVATASNRTSSGASAARPTGESGMDPVWGARLYGTPMMSQTPDPTSAGTAEQGAAGDQGSRAQLAMLDRPATPLGSLSTGSLGSGTAASNSGQPAATAAASKSSREHVVQKGETFSSIAAAAYGSPSYYPHILRANPKLDPTKLKPGTSIVLPDVSEVKPAATAAGKDGEPTVVAAMKPGTAAPVATLDEKTQYRIQSGDSLHKIALKLYGKIDMVDKLYDANKDVIGPDKAKLKLGAVLKLPAPPTHTASAAAE